ncbi:MAG: exodeoxyribonuclease VII large subunit [Candidatus Aquiluna sp. XM-24bin5]|nr:MAG: exodeoxyribonuclease VII large subunit [Candidatus Aquiluna sp. XM-24bin5]
MNQPTAHDVESKVSTEHSPWQVSQLSKSLKDWIEKLGRVWVEGELQQLQLRGSNIFGSLRDLDVENSIEIHAFDASSADIEVGLNQGDRVVALLQPQFWAKNGKLTMRVLKMHKVGLGELLERIEKLRQQLIAEGLTAPERKKPLPFLPGKIGLITGAKSDAEKDILQNARLRWPEVQFEVINTLVQGDKAPAEIILAMQQLDQMPDVEIIIIARGGGSFQDLLPFSDERLVRAAAALSKPVVSAIGHENDSPLLDLVADLRASTPTDAAKRVVPDVVEERKALSQLRDRLAFRVASYIDSQLQLIESITSRPVLKSPYGFIEYQEEQVGQLARRLTEILSFRVDRAESENTQLTARVRSLSPQLTMERGYAVVTGADGKQATSVKKGQQLKIQTAKQEISATADEVREK